MKNVSLRTWVDIAEITASLGVVVTLLILIGQIRESNTIKKQESLIRDAEWDSEVFLQSSDLADALTKIKAVDGIEEPLQELMNTYEMSYEQAAAWNRYVMLNWKAMEAEFLYAGRSKQLAAQIRQSYYWPDQQMLLRSAIGQPWSPFGKEFDEYVRTIIDEQD